MASQLESTLTRSFKIALLIGACLLFTIGALTGAILARYHYNGIIQANQSQYQADLKAVSDEAHTSSPQATVPAPAPWAMAPKSDSLSKLDSFLKISEPEFN
ncbi:TPA: hypothetical protein ACS726_001033 [Providencia alcalifaciens]